MNILIIVATDETPAIKLNKTTNTFSIKGRCYPENPDHFFKPVEDWIKEYCKNPNPDTVVDFEITYMNSASNKAIFDLASLFEAIQAPNQIKINWFCEDDGETDERGEELRDLLKIPVELVYLDEEEDTNLEDLY